MLPPQAMGVAVDPDASIRLTDGEASGARLSAVQLQYFQDPFVKYLVPRAHLQPSKPPLINIGTFVRSTAIDDLVHRWLLLSEHEGKLCQIVSLGAGSDTRFWRISTGPLKDRLAAYIEIDFPEVTTKKAMAIRKSKELNAVLGCNEDVNISRGGTLLHSPKYHLLPVDLRLPPSEALWPLLSTPSSDTDNPCPILCSSLPTLLLFECVLVYMSPTASSALIQSFVDYFSAPSQTEGSDGGGGVLGGIVYEMFGLEDSFGRVMLNNLQLRNVSLPGAKPYPSVSSLPGRFLDHDFTTASALTLREIRRRYIDPMELERIGKLEMLDEVEELELVLEHYAVTWGVKLPSDGSTTAAWDRWGLEPTGDIQDVDPDE